MAIKGSLREASLADVCQLLALGQKSGCLSVADGSRFGQIFFERGRITFARIVNRRDRLGDILVRDGVIAQSQLDVVLQHQARDPERRVGELLVAHQFISRNDLTQYIRGQIEEAIYHLFTWSRGNFFFEVDARPDDADVIVSINPESLLLEAARRIDEWSLIEKKIPSLDLIFEVEPERLDASDVELTAEQQLIVPLLTGAFTVQEVVDCTGLTEFEAGKALFGLVQAGFASSTGRRSDESARGRELELRDRRTLGVAFYRTGMLDDAGREFERVLELDGGDTSAREHLALINLREGRYPEAVRQLRLLLQDRGPRYSAFMNLALALRLLDRAEDALLALGEAESLRPDEPGTELSRGMTLMQLHRFSDAVRAFDEYRARLGTAPPAAAYFYHAALTLAIVHAGTAAGRLLEEGLELHPGSAPLLLLDGAMSERRGDLDSADRAYRQALDQDSSIAQAYKSLGDVAYRRGAHGEALEHYARAAELEPRLGDDVFARLGNLLYKAGRMDAAVENWRRALRLNPSNQIVRNNLDIVEHAAG